MKKIIKKVGLSLFCIYSLYFLLASISAPIMAHFLQYDMSAKLTNLFVYSCHQQPDRSFWLLGYPIALCCRCIGFYFGVATSSILALAGKFHIKPIFSIIMLLFTTTDIFINFILHIDTGNFTRFITGITMGLLFTTVLNYIFSFNRRKIGNEN